MIRDQFVKASKSLKDEKPKPVKRAPKKDAAPKVTRDMVAERSGGYKTR